jgi:hypothetical protein
MKKVTFLVLIVFQIFAVKSQTIKNVSSNQDGNKIKVNYTISDLTTPIVARVNLYYSLNNSSFNGPLNKVSGDVGEKNMSNGLKSMTWDLLSEVGSLDGSVTFKVEIVPVKPKIIVPTNKVDNFELSIPLAKYSNGKLTVEFVIKNFGDDVYGLIRGDKFSVTDATGTVFVPESISFANINEKKLDNTHKVIYQNQVPFKVTCVFNSPELQSTSLSSAFVRSNKIPDYDLDWRERNENILFLISTKNIPVQ